MLTNEDVRITFYSLTRCGFYPWGMQKPWFGGISDIFSQLEQWGKDTELSLTKVLDPAPDDDQLPVYLMGITTIGDDFVFACWNEVPSADGAITSLSKTSKVSEPQVHQNTLSPDTIPGYATYFWVVPSKNVIASVKFLGTTSGMAAMGDYIKKFISLKTRYAIDGTNEQGEYTVVGYTNKGDGIPLNVRPRFHVQTYRKKGRRSYLVANHARINKVIRVGSVAVDKVMDKGILQAFIHFVRGDVNQTHHITGIRKAKLELQYTPSEAELIAMMEADDADEDGTRWEDLGFELVGEAAPIWINKSRASDTYSLDVERAAGDVISVLSIAKSLAMQRAEVLKLLEDA